MSEVLLKRIFDNIPADKRAEVRPVLEDSNVPAILRADTVQKMHLKWWKQGLDKKFETEEQLTNWYSWQFENFLNNQRNKAIEEMWNNKK